MQKPLLAAVYQGDKEKVVYFNRKPQSAQSRLSHKNLSLALSHRQLKYIRPHFGHNPINILAGAASFQLYATKRNPLSPEGASGANDTPLTPFLKTALEKGLFKLEKHPRGGLKGSLCPSMQSSKSSDTKKNMPWEP